MYKILSLSILCFLFVSPVLAKDLFVSTTGSNATSYANNDIDNPWLTVEYAWANALDNDTVYYRGGTYTITAEINNVTSGEGVTHTSYFGEQAVWNSSLCQNNGVIHVSEDYTTIDGIDGNWTGAEYCLADTGFFELGYSTKGGVADYFTFKNGDWTQSKYGQNGGIVLARSVSGDISTNGTIEGISIVGPGVGDPSYGSINSSLIITFSVEDWTIKNNELRDSNIGIYFNKHPNAESTDGGTIENNFIYNTIYAIRTQTNGTTFHNNVFGDAIQTGHNSGDNAVDGNVGSDNNVWTHNTFIGRIYLAGHTDGGDNSLIGTVNNSWHNNIMPPANVEIHRYVSYDTEYTGDYNLWPTSGNIYVYNSSIQALATYQTTLGGCPGTDNECNSLEQSPTFEGGSSPTTIDGFALTDASYGYGAASDSTDMGVNISIVGADPITYTQHYSRQ